MRTSCFESAWPGDLSLTNTGCKIIPASQVFLHMMKHVATGSQASEVVKSHGVNVKKRGPQKGRRGSGRAETEERVRSWRLEAVDPLEADAAQHREAALRFGALTFLTSHSHQNGLRRSSAADRSHLSQRASSHKVSPKRETALLWKNAQLFSCIATMSASASRIIQAGKEL